MDFSKDPEKTGVVAGACAPRLSGLVLLLAWSLLGMPILGFEVSPAGAQTRIPGDGRGTPAAASKPAPKQNPQHQLDLKSLPENIFVDQKTFWSTPFRMTARQWQWTVPLAFAGAGLLASDTVIERHAPANPATVSRAVTFSNAGLATLVGTGGGLFLWGHLVHDDQKREAGLLSGQAAIDAALQTEVFKYAMGRDRPSIGDGRGRFFQGGDSFPSGHSAAAWAIASVIAHEYPGPLTKLMVYGLAGGISASRFAGHKHFAADVAVGSALGWFTGRQVFRAHAQYAGVSNWDSYGGKGDEVPNAANMGSPFVPLDSWIYPAMQRLVALGYIQSAHLGMRPWTRMECARLLAEAGGEIEATGAENGEAETIYGVLGPEFADETARLAGGANFGISLDSIYSRFTGISGLPLRDGLHFAQTVVNDYGRPYARGFNNLTGFSGHAVAGPLVFYLRGEYQHAPTRSGISSQTAQAIQAVDGLPVAPPGTPTPSVNRLDLLEAYVGVQLNNWQITFGKQALWWGQDASGPMLFSTNAAPILMLQINRVKPFHLPSFLNFAGPIRVDYLVGRLSGQQWVYSAASGFTGSWVQSLRDQPFIVGQKLSFKPTANLEFGLSATALFGGAGVPATPHKLLQAMFSTGNGIPGSPGDAGDRRGGFDFAYRIPRLRNWLTFYGDAFTDDESNPWLAWNKAAVTSGVYLARMPGVPKLDFRAEGLYTDLPGGQPTVQHGFFYNNSRFRSGYTNQGSLIGSWIGRQGQGAQAWTNYWFTPKNKLQVSFRHQKVSQQFIPGGGTLTDFGVSGEYWIRPQVCVSAWLQRERWLFPIIQPSPSENVVAGVEILLNPIFSRHSPASGSRIQP